MVALAYALYASKAKPATNRTATDHGNTRLEVVLDPGAQTVIVLFPRGLIWKVPDEVEEKTGPAHRRFLLPA